MARHKVAKKQSAGQSQNTTAQQRRSISKVKENPFKAKQTKQKGKKASNKIAETFANMQKQQQKPTTKTPTKMTKQVKRKAQENLNLLDDDIVDKRRKDQAASCTMTSNSTNVNNNHPRPSPAVVPNVMARLLKNGNRRSSTKSKSTPDTIVIDDSDEENESTPPPLFYVDRNPGIRDEEVPLYIVNDDGGGAEATHDPPTVAMDERPTVSAPDDSVIVLDNTLDQTIHDSMKEMQIGTADIVVDSGQPSSSRSAEGTSSLMAAFSATTVTHSNKEAVEKESKENDNEVVEILTVPDVIDLSDDSDVEKPSTSYTAKLTTPAFPALDRIPLGFSMPKQRANPVVNPPAQKQSHKNGKGTGDMENKKRMIVIDGNNVAYGHLNGRMFSVKGLELCINYFKKLGHEVTAVVPQFKLKRNQSTDYVLLEKLHKQGDVTLAPCKSLPGQFSSSYDDRLILSIAEQFDAVIISNDNFRDLLDISKEWRRIIETRVVGYTWVKDCFFLPDDPYGRRGPTLQQILNGSSH